MTETPDNAVPVAQRSSWSSFLKSIASFSGDLSSMTAPPFILSPTSLTEFPAYWCERPDLFAAIKDQPVGSEGRALAVLRWFISTLKDQYTSRNEKLGSEKKPLNPALGELFYATLPATTTRTRTDLLVEQVSHHPPITAYVIRNAAAGIQLTGHSAQKTAFSAGSITVRQLGHAILSIAGENGQPDEYLITLPRLRIDGLWYGSPYIELVEKSYVVGGGYVSTVEYKGKGYFTGKTHSFKATLAPLAGKSDHGAPTVIEGVWDQSSRFVKGPKTGVFHDVAGPKVEFVPIGGEVVEGEAEPVMGPMETRRLWASVSRGIREGDFETASQEKGKIENDMRQRRKEEAAAGTVWPLKHFAHEALDPSYERLAKMAKVTPTTDDRYVFSGQWPRSMEAASEKENK